MPSGNVIRLGIEFDKIGRCVAYHFPRRHPSELTDPVVVGETARIPASEIVRIIDPVDAGQLRGISRFAAGIAKLFLLDQYDDAELDRKKVDGKTEDEKFVDMPHYELTPWRSFAKEATPFEG